MPISSVQVQLHAEAKATRNNLRMANSLYAVAYEAADSTQRQYDKGAVDIVQRNQNLSSLQQAQLELAQSQAQRNRAKLRLWLQATWPARARHCGGNAKKNISTATPRDPDQWVGCGDRPTWRRFTRADGELGARGR